MLRRDVAAHRPAPLRPRARIRGDDGGSRPARQEIIARALRSGSFEHPGCARLLDVLAPGAPGLPDGVLGAAVTEWVPGRSLAEAVADGMIKPLAAARAPCSRWPRPPRRRTGTASCWAATTRSGSGSTTDGRAADGLRAAAPRPDARPTTCAASGAALYTLLTVALAALGLRRRPGRAEARRAGRGRGAAAAVHGPPRRAGRAGDAGRRHAGRRLRRRAGPHRRRGAQRRRRGRGRGGPRRPVPARARRGAARSPATSGSHVAPRPSSPIPASGASWPSGMAGLGLCVLGVAGYIERRSSASCSAIRPRASWSAAARAAGVPAAAPAQADGGAAAPVGDAAVKAVGADVYDDAGDRDNAGRVSRVIDGNPARAGRPSATSSSSRRSSRASGS